MNDMSNLEPIVHHLRKFERVKSSYNDMEVSLLPGHRHIASMEKFIVALHPSTVPLQPPPTVCNCAWIGCGACHCR